ncbi:MAG: tetratricopeptide repeat protein [Actinomycetota bacterium]
MVGSRLRRLRQTRGLTQRELGEPRYTHAYVSTIEAGRRRPSQEALEHFASKLGVEVDELITGRPPGFETQLRLRLQDARVAISDGRFEQAERDLAQIAREAKRHRLPRLEAKTEEIRGLWLQRTGRPEDALERYQRAEDLLRDEPPTARADAVDGKATCFAALGDVRYAIFLLESALDEIDRAGFKDPDALVRLHSALVYWYLDLGLIRNAAESAAVLEPLAPRIDDPERVAQMHMNVARQYLSDGRVENATASLQRAEDAYRGLGLQAERGSAHLARGFVLLRQGDLEDARGELEKARTIFERTGNTKNLTRTLNELARLARLEGDVPGARALLERSIALLGTSDDPELAYAHLELGRVLADADPSRAEKHLRVAVEIYERTEQAIGLAVSYRALGDVLRAGGDDTAGSEAYRTGILAVEPLL